MNAERDRLYELLPVVHRVRDEAEGHPLRDLLRVVGERVSAAGDDIARLYDNWFIETCEDWAVPYLGDLIGYRPVEQAAGLPVSRKEVADTLAFRRRKGTLALLELLAGTVAGWPARAVEFQRLLSWTQHTRHRHPDRGRTVDLRDGDALDRLGGPFEAVARTVDVRRTGSARTPGRHNLPSIGLFVWRLKLHPVTGAPACCSEGDGAHCYTFSALGNDTPLFTLAVPEAEPTTIAGETNLPAPIRRRALAVTTGDPAAPLRADEAYYGPGRSLVIHAPNWPVKDAPQPVPASRVVPADLTGWGYRVPRGHVAVDPARGRIQFPADQLPKGGVAVVYHQAFSADMGGGEYRRPLSQPDPHRLYRVGRDAGAGAHPTINAALLAWQAEKPAAAVIEIADSGVYTEPLTIALDAGQSLQIRAADRRRPILRLLDFMADRPDPFLVTGRTGSRFVLDGLVVAGRGLKVLGPDPTDAEALAEGDLCDVTIRHCTLVPGWSLEADCSPCRPAEPSLELVDTSARILIRHSILGPIHVIADEVLTDPVAVDIADSIVDATATHRPAIAAADRPLAFLSLAVARSTVIGTVDAHAIASAQDTLFLGTVRVGRRQQGCVRFCYVPPGSRTPRRHMCQPDMAVRAAEESAADPQVADRAREHVRPCFDSLRYGTPAYARLAPDCAAEIARGAEDESEMGAFHHLHQPQRLAALRARLDEYTPAGMDTGIMFAS